ncbi:MAG TPA: serine protease [Thermoplasmata archaeon]|nr:serine protease [Thermoplasmata archaeon]
MALIPPFFLDCVVAIGEIRANGDRSWAATGFIYGHLVARESPEKADYRTYLVTNRHVVIGKTRVLLRFNPKGGAPAKEYMAALVDGSGKPIWFAPSDPQVDVAVVPIDYAMIENDGIQTAAFLSDRHVADISKMFGAGITEGDFVYVLGFPFGDVGDQRSFVITRGGVLARIGDALARRTAYFLVDALVFPGNSGGPVVSKPEAVAIQGTQGHTSADLIGVIAGYIPYRDAAVSEQTGLVRIIFEDNSGLSLAYPIDYVTEAILLHLKTIAPSQPGLARGSDLSPEGVKLNPPT